MAAKPIPSASLSALQTVANTLLAVLAPTTSRLVRVAVVCDEREDTAYTDGNLIIALPTSFCGCPLPEDAAVSVGLLAHEAGHFVQPLAAIRRVEEEDGAPHWLSNILLDVHGEAFVETVFPALAGPLQATRQAVHKTLADRYRQDLAAAPTFLEAAAPAALLARFAHPSLVFHPKWTQETAWQQQPWLAEATLFLDLMAQAARLPALALPDHLRIILRRFPALSHSLLPLLPAYGSTRADSLGRVLLGEAALGGQGATGWQVPRLNYLFGKLTKGAGYWPDYQMRLLKRGCARYTRPASEIVELVGQSACLTNPLIHFNYESIAQFHQKQQVRIDFEARNLLAQGVKLKFYTPYYMTLRHFWWRLGTLKGYRDGVHGLRLSGLLAYYFGYRYYRRAMEIARSITGVDTDAG